MAKNLIIVALPEELGIEATAELRGLCEVRFSGVGKLCAYEATLEALLTEGYDNIINVGTCGSSKYPFATLLHPGTVVQGDLYLDGPFSTPKIVIGTGDEGVAIVSGDNFIGEETHPAHLERLKPYDCIDMEAYAIDKAIKLYSRLRNAEPPKLYLIKCVSDGADGALEDWGERAKKLRPILLAATKELLSKL